jgi:hypothetical protein
MGYDYHRAVITNPNIELNLTFIDNNIDLPDWYYSLYHSLSESLIYGDWSLFQTILHGDDKPYAPYCPDDSILQ